MMHVPESQELLKAQHEYRKKGLKRRGTLSGLSQDPAMRVIVGWQGSERKGASTSEMGRFEREFLTQEDNRQALARMNTRWVERAMAHNPFVELVRELLWMLSKVVRPVVWLFVRVPARLLLRRRTDSRRTPR